MALGNLRIERARPLGDHDRRKAVADRVAGSDRHRHKAVHAEDDRDPFNGQDAGRCHRRREHDERSPRDRGRAFGRQQHQQQQANLMLERDRHSVRVGDKQDAHRHEERRSVEVERVPGGQYKADGLLGAAEPFEFDQEARQRTLGPSAISTAVPLLPTE